MSMRNLWTLLRLQSLLNWRSFRARIGGGRSRWGLLLLPLLLLCFVPFIGIMMMGYAALYLAGNALGQGQLVLVLALTAGQLACLMFGVFYVISAFYFSRDLGLLVPLPLRADEIVLAKFLGILGGEYLTMAPVVLPALVVYGVMARVSWLYLPFAVVIYLLLPVVPLVLSALFSIALMRLTSLRRNRDLWRVIGALIGVAVGLGFQFVGRFAGGGPSPQSVQELLTRRATLIHTINRFFPTSKWAADALRSGASYLGIPSLALYVALVAVALVLLALAAQRLFFAGLLGGEESRPSGKALTRADLAAQTGRVNPPLLALLQREIRLLNRTPSFLMSAVLPVIMLPIFIAIPLLQNGREMAKLLDRLPQWQHSPLVPIIAVGTLLVLNGISNLAATAISREGGRFWISRSLPVVPRVQVLAKVLHSLLFSLLNIAVVIAMLAYLRLITPVTLGYLVVAGLTGSVATAYSSITIDLLRPHLHWTDPQQAMKGNLNVLLGMIATFLLGGLYVAVAVFGSFVAPVLVLPGTILLFAVEAYALAQLAGGLADRRYLEYED